MNIKEFKQIFTDSVLDKLSKNGYRHKKSKEVFERVEGEHVFYLYVYMYRRTSFIEIETKAFYGNKKFTKELKHRGIKLPYECFCGGELEFLSEYYFNKDFPEKYSNLIFMIDEEPEYIIKDWLGYFESIVCPFFEDCKNPKLLNDMINNIPIEKVGLNATYQTRVFYSYFAGQKADIKNEELLELINLYANELKSWGDDCDYINDFLQLKNTLINKITADNNV